MNTLTQDILVLVLVLGILGGLIYYAYESHMVSQRAFELCSSYTPIPSVTNDD